MKIVNVVVFNGRHDIQQAMDGAVFKQTISEMNPEKLYNSAQKRLVNEYKLIEKSNKAVLRKRVKQGNKYYCISPR